MSVGGESAELTSFVDSSRRRAAVGDLERDFLVWPHCSESAGNEEMIGKPSGLQRLDKALLQRYHIHPGCN